MNFKTLFLFLSAIIITGKTSAQYNSDRLTYKFQQYAENTLHEKIFVHTDKTSYLASELIWFSIYTLEAGTNHKTNLSKIAYVELLDADNKPVLQAKIDIKEGIGEGSFYLPATLSSGNYVFRAYTNWMKNSSPDYYFHKTLTISNTLEEQEKATPLQAENYNIQFFPEGGNLIDGISSKIAFRAVDNNGKGIAFKGAILNHLNDTIAQFKPSRYGIGTFNFTPDANIKYKIFITPLNKKSFTSTLPEIHQLGYVMRLAKQTDGNYKLTVNTTTQGDDNLFLFVHSGHTIGLKKNIPIINGVAETAILKEQFGDGISHITVFDERLNPVCERLHFKKPTKTLKIDAKATSQRYSKREKVNIEVSNFNELNKPVSSEFSMSVHLSDSLETHNDIGTFAWLTSELKGQIEDPNYYFNNPDEEAVDNLMLTHGWSRFKWNELRNYSIKQNEFLPELDGHIITVKITNPVLGSPIANKISYLSIPGRRLQFYTALSNNNGNIKFHTKDFYGLNEIILQTDPSTDSVQTDILDPFSKSYSSLAPLSFNLSNTSLPNLTDRSIAVQVTNAFFGKYFKKEFIAKVDSTPFYTPINKTYKLDNFVRFTTMEEVLKEYVPEIYVEKRKKSYNLRILDFQTGEFYTTPPLMLVDGVPILDNGDKIVKYDPAKIQKLELVNNEYFYGPSVFKGIASFSTYKGDLSGLEIDPRATVIDYEGVQLEREFYSPMYSDDKNDPTRIPDFRSTLFWASKQQTDKDGKASLSFYTSDLPGKYTIILHGIAPGGRLGSKTIDFEIKK